MSTKIFYNDNRIIIDGHADTPQECQAITAMCDEMANSENFKTIVYEQGHAVFERVSGGDALMFADLEPIIQALKMQVSALETRVSEIENGEYLSQYLSRNEASLLYVTRAAHSASEALLRADIDKINGTLGTVDTSSGTVGEQLANAGGSEAITALETRMETVESMVSTVGNKTEVALPFTADELIAKLESI